jgi:uncharacterized protein YyaL (SSP411 family)
VRPGTSQRVILYPLKEETLAMKRQRIAGVILTVFLSLAIVMLTGGQTVQAQSLTSRESNLERAVASYNALQKYFSPQDDSSLYLEEYPLQSSDNPYSYEWPFSQAYIATLDLSNLPGEAGGEYTSALANREIGQEHYWNTTGTTGLAGYDSYVRPPYGSGGDKFYDDNEWAALAKVQQYLTTGNQSSLERAKQIFALVVSGWDTSTTHADPGGVFWTQASWSSDRNTVSNMPGAELGLRLYQITGDRYYFDWAKRMYDWTNKYLQTPNGLYWDHLDLQGNIQTTEWSYNQGVPVGVNVLFYEVTGDGSYLREAERIANAALAYYGTSSIYNQPAYFNSIFFKNLLLLQSTDHNQTYARAMQTYADTVWETNRDAQTGLFHFSGSTETQLLEQAAMTQIYAVLSWEPSEYHNLY